jgi:aryl-alcohol dehydrogenase-like predicted oxidoreductase
MEVSPSTQDAVLKRLSPLVMGGAGFSYQLHPQPESLPVRRIIKTAFDLGLRAIDTSPYYEPSEQLIGAALCHPEMISSYKRSDYVLMTKVGRLGQDHFDYSPEWIRNSVARSLQRFGTSYLDVVFCHDVEFVSIEEAARAVETLYGLSSSGVVRCVGISGADITVLEAVALRVLSQTGRAVDVIQAWGQLTLQNTRLEQRGLEAFRRAGVKAVCSSSPLGVGLLRSDGVPVGALGNWHPAPPELRAVCQQAAKWVQDQGDNLASVALRFAISRAQQACRSGFNVTTITGITSLSDLEENILAAQTILQKPDTRYLDDMLFQYGGLNEETVERDRPLYEGVSKILGPWLDYDFVGPPKSHVQAQVKPDVKIIPSTMGDSNHVPTVSSWLRTKTVVAQQ